MALQLVLATNNRHKLDEISAKLQGDIQLLSLQDIGFDEDIEETGVTFRENASLKSRQIYNKFGLNCFGDDSGLVVDAINGEPGVYSARYAGKHGDHDANIDKLLGEMANQKNRSARFITVISLIWEGQEHFFEGTVEGAIRHQRSGTGGFGYDPVFQPGGFAVTFAEMGLDEKNLISHRSRAVDQMISFLKR